MQSEKSTGAASNPPTMNDDTIVAHTEEMVEEAKAIGAITSYNALLEQRQDKNVLRFVTEKVFIQNLEHHFRNMTAVSMTDKEEAAIEADLGTDVAIYLFYAGSNQCNNCDRMLNAYDFYFSGKEVHGNVFRSIIIDGPHKVHLGGFKSKATVVCSNCQSRNVFLPIVEGTGGGDGGTPCYNVGKYVYA
jgi:hypothetical protein